MVLLLVGLIAGQAGIGATAYFTDAEPNAGNTFEAWVSSQWVQTTQLDFEAGVLNQVDTSSSPGNVKLATTSNWYNTNWQYRRAITIDHTKVDNVANPSSTYADFPVLVYATGLSNIKADGADIRFTSSDGTSELPREIERYSSGTLYAWVKVTLTKDAGDTSNDVIYMYYGNTAATEPAPGSTYGSQNVWGSNHKGVWHLKEDPSGTAPQMKDSTTNGNNGTSGGSMTSGDQVAGKIDGSLYFDGSNHYVQVNDSASLRIGSAITVSAWIYPYSVATGSHRIISKWTPSNQEYILYLSGTEVGVGIKTGYGVTSGANLAINTWYHLEMVWSGSNTITVYKNGSLLQNVTITPGTTGTSSPLVFAKHGSLSSEYFNGIIDETRVSMTNESANWIKTCYNNQIDPGSFYNVGTQENKYLSPGSIASDVLDTIVAGAKWDALFWDETLPSNTDITFEVRASDTLFAKNATTPNWIDLGLANSPITSGLPSGRYMQWRATLTTSDTSKTPTLQEVTIDYY
jgi:hypothetical protein